MLRLPDRPSVYHGIGSYLTDNELDITSMPGITACPFCSAIVALFLVGRGQPSAPLRKFPILPRYACRIERR